MRLIKLVLIDTVSVVYNTSSLSYCSRLDRYHYHGAVLVPVTGLIASIARVGRRRRTRHDLIRTLLIAEMRKGYELPNILTSKNQYFKNIKKN